MHNEQMVLPKNYSFMKQSLFVLGGFFPNSCPYDITLCGFIFDRIRNLMWNSKQWILLNKESQDGHRGKTNHKLS